MTLSASVTPDEVLQLIDASVGASVKDSFSTLDLTPHGFTVLFDAQWLWWKPDGGAVVPALEWLPVRSVDDLARWARAQSDTPPFPPALLDDPRVTVLQTRSDRHVAGAVLFAEDDVVGLTNFHASGAALDLAWSSLLIECRRRHPGHSICGYESGPALDVAIAAGASPCGPLRVWVRES